MLMIDSGTKRVSEELVRAVPEPEFTETWHPVSHARLIAGLEKSLPEVGLEVTDRQYSLSQNGLKMFGVWQLGETGNGTTWCIGLRNSMDKSMAVGLVAGIRVFVCDNLSFSGDYVEFRKHTAGLTDDTLMQMCNRGMTTLQTKLVEFDQWHQNLMSIAIRKQEAQVLTFQAMAAGIIIPSKFQAFYALYFAEGARYEGESLYDWHGAVTELMNGNSLFQVADKNRRLTGLLNQFIGQL